MNFIDKPYFEAKEPERYSNFEGKKSASTRRIKRNVNGITQVLGPTRPLQQQYS